MTLLPAEIYATAGPYATMYLDATRSTEEGDREVDLRWRAHREELAQAGADEATLDAIAAVVGQHRDATGPPGQVVVAAAGEVRFDAVLPQPPARPGTRWAPLPHLMPYLAQRGPAIAYVLVVADREGADVWSTTAQVATEGEQGQHDVVKGSVTWPVHMARDADRSAWHFQNKVDNTEAANAREIAERVADHVGQAAARLVLVGGDERARTLVAQDVPNVVNPNVDVVEIDAGARGQQSAAEQEALDAAVHDALLHRVWRERRDVLAKLQEGFGRGDYAVAGVPAVIDALRRAQVETLIVSDDPSSTLKAWIGPDPLVFGATAEELHEMGVDEPQEDRLDAALVRAVIGGGADVLITPDAHRYVDGGIAARLRYADASTVR